LKLYGISKESYHGGQLSGNGCRGLVAIIGEIGPEMFKIITEHQISDHLSNSDVKVRVGYLFQIFGLIDAAFSPLMTIDPSDIELATSEISMNVLMIREWVSH
jgi:hypothetical protein